jgi:hypothetical protein
MKTRTKLVFLELVAGIFGWMWLTAGAATLYFIIAAIWLNGSWSMILVAIATSIICKWLAKGFNDNKIRVAYEAELISSGMAPEEAGKSWTQAYLGKNKNSNTNSGEKEAEIVRNYATYIAKNPIIDEIKDRSCLPYERDQILEALLFSFRKISDANQRKQIKVLATTLAFFQTNVGKDPLTLLGAEFYNLPNDSGANIEEIAKAIDANNASARRYFEFNDKVQVDTRKILARFE